MSRRLITGDGRVLVGAGGALSARGRFRDDFDRGTPGVVRELGNGWGDLGMMYPRDYDTIGILNQQIVVRALSRQLEGREWARNESSVGGGEDYVWQPDRLLPGIIGAVRDYGGLPERIDIRWLGLSGRPTLPHSECASLWCFTPGTPELAFGAWYSTVGINGSYAPVILIGSIGHPPEIFADQLDDVGLFTHTTGTPRTVSARCDGTGLTFWIDDVQIPGMRYGTSPVPIPENLRGSTIHGFAMDDHIINYENGRPSLANLQAAPGVDWIEMSGFVTP